MSTKAEIHDQIETNLKPKKKKLEQEHTELLPKFQQAAFALPGAISKYNEPMVTLYRDTLQKGTEHFAVMLSKTDVLLDQLKELAKDEGVLDDFKEVEALTAELSELRRKFNKDYGIGKTLLDQANDALEKHKQDASDTTEEWAVMEAWLRTKLDRAKKQLTQMLAARDAAKKAVAARNQKALDDAAKLSSQVVDLSPTLDEIKKQFEGFCDKCEAKGLSKEQQEQLARDRKTFEGIVAEYSEIAAKLVSTDVEIEGLEIPGVDVKKAAALLKVPSSQEAKLKKALEAGSGILKALDALGKELTPNTTGKAMIAALKKAKLL